MADAAPAKPILHRLARRGGQALAVACVGLILWRVASAWPDVAAAWTPTSAGIAALTGLAVAYGLALFLVVEIWHQCLSLFSPEPRRISYPSAALTQIAKYLPGNVMHLLGRAIYLRSGGVRAADIGAATLLEVLILPLASALLLAALYFGSGGLSGAELPAIVNDWTLAAGTAAVVAAVLAVAVLRRDRARGLPGTLFRATLIGTAFMALLGLIFHATALLVAAPPPAVAVFAAVLGWLVGYLTPGAPGGIGTREVAMLVLLTPVMGEGPALVAAALFRGVTTLGDLVCFAVCRAAIGTGPRPSA